MNSQNIFAWSCLAATVFLASACASSTAQAGTAPAASSNSINSAQVNSNAQTAFRRLDGDGVDKPLTEDAADINAQLAAPAQGETAEQPAAAVSEAQEVPQAEAAPAAAAAEAEAEPAAAAAEAAPASAEEVTDEGGQDYTQAPPAVSSAAAEAPAEAPAAAAAAAEAQAPSCTVGRAPGRRQPSDRAKKILCAHAAYDLGCQNGAVDISVIASGSPWVFNAKGCGMEATYHMVGNSISYIGGSAIGAAQAASPDSAPLCAVRPYHGRQMSDTAKAIVCNQSRYDLQCPSGDLYITVLRIGMPPYSWLLAVDGCGYSARYSMIGDILSRTY